MNLFQCGINDHMYFYVSCESPEGNGKSSELRLQSLFYALRLTVQASDHRDICFKIDRLNLPSLEY